jgi:Ca2+/Na+ antiporter
MEWWQIFGVVFVICTVMFVYSSFAEAAQRKKQMSLEISSTKNNMLQNWNENEISRELIKLQGKPSMLVHYVESIRQRFVERQDVKTSAVRIAFLEKQVNLLRLGNEYEALKNELALRRRGFENEVLKINLENQNLRMGFADEAAEREIRELENERRRIEQELEVAKLRKELDAINNPPVPTQALSKAEKDAQTMKELEEKIARVTEKIEKIEKYSVLSEDERQRQVNQLRNRLFDLEERQNDLL